MANEANINASLNIKIGNNQYRSVPTSFKADVADGKGPSPGAVTCDVLPGTNIDLSELVQPALCRLMNIDDTNFVTVGVYDGTSFYPLLDLLPGETYIVRLSRYINQEFVGTGTNADANNLRIVADTAACDVLVEAFEA